MNNAELERLSKQHTQASKQLYELAVENESLEMRANGMKGERDMHVLMDERHKIEMLKVDIADAVRRAERMELSLTNTISSWQSRVSVMQRQVFQMQ